MISHEKLLEVLTRLDPLVTDVDLVPNYQTLEHATILHDVDVNALDDTITSINKRLYAIAYASISSDIARLKQDFLENKRRSIEQKIYGLKMVEVSQYHIDTMLFVMSHYFPEMVSHELGYFSPDFDMIVFVEFMPFSKEFYIKDSNDKVLISIKLLDIPNAFLLATFATSTVAELNLNHSIDVN